MIVRYHILSDTEKDIWTSSFFIAVRNWRKREDDGRQIWKEIYADGTDPMSDVPEDEFLVIDVEGQNVEHLGIRNDGIRKDFKVRLESELSTEDFDYDSEAEARAGLVRLVHSCRKHFRKDKLERKLTLVVATVEINGRKQ